MKKTILFAIGMALATSPAFSAEGIHWGYSGKTGPADWAKLSPEYSSCDGKNQSPINLDGFIPAKLVPLVFDYKGGSAEILNNGHTIQINARPGSTVGIDGIEFELKQYHFHAPSENLIKGKSFPMEAHLVHADQNGNIVVVAVMFTAGEANKALEKAWNQMPKTEGEKLALSSDISPLDLLPPNHAYYRFNGSLTTPPCTEGVRWVVIKDAVSASAAQIEEFARVMHHPNNRPVQSINARSVLE
ncbi:MAG: carbonic anhydrase family protein [Desulfocapsaceae bacterium]|nr:carbonic anhydrase family protein [Desulfocapsaceae bacterium]